MRPFDETPVEEDDYSDVALLIASVREWPNEEFAHDLDARVARRFAPVAASPSPRRLGRRVWIAAGPVVAVVAGAVAAVVVLSGGGANRAINGGTVDLGAAQRAQLNTPTKHAKAFDNTTAPSLTTPSTKQPSLSGASGLSATGAPSNAYSGRQPATVNTTSSFSAPVAPGSKQIRSAQVSLTTANQHVDQVASEVFDVVGTEHGSVLSSHVTTATSSSGGGYASFTLSIPTGNLQDAMTQLSRLHYAALTSSSAGSQNVSNQYNADQRQLADAKALRTSLLKQLQTAYTQSAIDSIKAQLKLAEQQINTWQSTLGSLQHRISHSNLTVEINAGGLPVTPVTGHSSSFTIGRAGHDALRVLVVSAGVALIALAVALPIGLVAALLVWLWVWLRQRRREHALDATS